MRGRGDQPVMGIRGGAPVAPAALTIGDRVKNTPAYRDSMARAVLGRIPELAKKPMTVAEKRELEASQAQGRKVMERTTTAGSREVHIMQGQGKDGEGAVGGNADGVHASVGQQGVTVSVPFPLFSPGPSPEQRKKNEALERDYNSRLGRLNDRLLLIRDSIRADSLRRDSLAKARKVVP
jgi:hypothetical protein